MLLNWFTQVAKRFLGLLVGAKTFTGLGSLCEGERRKNGPNLGKPCLAGKKIIGVPKKQVVWRSIGTAAIPSQPSHHTLKTWARHLARRNEKQNLTAPHLKEKWYNT